MNSHELLQLAAKACDDKRAEELVALDMRELSLIADYFLICHGTNERQVDAISKGIKDAVEEQGIEVKKIEGKDEARWVLVDLDDVVVHIFHKEERSYYNLEKLWGDADQVALTV
ncbi:ribosome silencing factor [Alkalibacillus haloalkaliphilus]|uniref:Ribosomal silencing factor RsfS n=1 Tax=Alkalibacillus haloalkaliphilus TaxID=94136 RepID=A0A511W5W1_9BACI|nr:ribosome silencing factor [Alkalibacillus haloalkaliphilus]MDV2581053.1 ribosome silencing factor [Alkalibacillus haloalkaliphilus]GEN46476.1 ribosomal silencing factor RsfS [Alkalibacillus haloalkaliphilus]